MRAEAVFTRGTAMGNFGILCAPAAVSGPWGPAGGRARAAG